jgi:hypothetical protein
MTDSMRTELLAALHARAVGGDNDAARILLAEPRRIAIDNTQGDDPPSRYDVWAALCKGVMTLPEANAWLEFLGRI